MRSARKPIPTPIDKETTPARWPFMLLASLAFIVVGALGVIGFHQINYAGRVFPGVHLEGIDVSGLRAEQVFAAAQAQTFYYRSRALTLKVGESKFVYRPADFGVGLDPAETTRIALSIGHEGDWSTRLQEQWRAYWTGIDISPVVLLHDGPAKNVLAKLATRTQKDPVNAEIELDNASAREIPSQKGSKIDIGEAFNQIRVAIQAGQSAEITLPLIELAPARISAAEVAAVTSKVVSNDLVVMVPKWDERDQPVGPLEAFRIRSADMSQFITLDEAAGNQLQLRFKREKLRSLIEPYAPAVAQSTENAKFTFDVRAGALKLLTRSRVGRALDIEQTLDNIETAARGDLRQAMIAVTTTQPPVSDSATAQQLGLKELLISATTGFKGSNQARLANVKAAAARFNGVVIEPQATFSFNAIVGNISKEEGFEEGLVIVGNRTVKGVGGGVCQVSTTAFQAALRYGFPIVERYPHGYRVRYYEDKNFGLGPGYDATVFAPWADLKFVNDSDTHVLIETQYDPAKVTLTFNLYGTSDGRKANLTPGIVENEVPAPTDIYEKDTEGDVKPGEIKQTDFAVAGATISFNYTVSRDGEVISTQKFVSKYTPWANRFKFGEGAKLPEGAQVVAADPQ